MSASAPRSAPLIIGVALTLVFSSACSILFEYPSECPDVEEECLDLVCDSYQTSADGCFTCACEEKPTSDAGPAPEDAGPAPGDAGAPVLDGGPVFGDDEPDAGPAPDAGPPPQPVDAGGPAFDAGGSADDLCPDPDAADVHYVADSDEDPGVCTDIVFDCEEDQELFSDECGCGCIDLDGACALAEAYMACPECYDGDPTCTYGELSATAPSCGECQARGDLYDALCEAGASGTAQEIEDGTTCDG